MKPSEKRTRVVIERSGAVLLAVGIASSISVYLGHGWFHSRFLPALGIAPAVGDSIGGFFIILVAFLAQRLVSLAIFNDIAFGLLRVTQQLETENQVMQVEIGELDQLASIDRLTGAWNRRRLESLVSGEIERLSRYDHALSILFLDIDHFKAINDSYGHAVGDQVLVELTGLLRASLRSADSLTRWGGEEFVVLCPGTPLATAIVLAERLRGIVDGTAFKTVGDVKISLGIAECQNGEDWQQWFARADAALYQAKANGRNQVQFAPETFAGEPNPSANLIQLSWHQAYACGNKSIDREHQSLFTIANALLCAMLSESSPEDIKKIIHVLIGEVTSHFRNEETIIAAAGFPGLREHQDLHGEILEKADRLSREFAAGTLEIGSLFQFLAHDVVARHMLVADYEFFPYLGKQSQKRVATTQSM